MWSDINETTKIVDDIVQKDLCVDEEDTDEELEEKYANLQVDFDESETEEEDYDFNKENAGGDFPDEFFIYETRDNDGPIAASRGKSFIQDDNHPAHGKIKYCN